MYFIFLTLLSIFLFMTKVFLPWKTSENVFEEYTNMLREKKLFQCFLLGYTTWLFQSYWVWIFA